MIKSAVVAGITCVAVAGCQSPQLGMDKPFLVYGQYSEIGYCILEHIKAEGISSGSINYKEIASAKIVDIELPMYGIYGPQDTYLAFKVEQVDADTAEVRMTAFSSLDNGFVELARRSVSECSKPVPSSPMP